MVGNTGQAWLGKAKEVPHELLTPRTSAQGKHTSAHPCCLLCTAVENTQLTLNLQTENKGGVVSGGELTIFLDGPTVDLGSVPNGSAVTDGEYCPAPRAVWGHGRVEA